MAITEHEFALSERRMAALRQSGHVVSVRYDRRSGRVVVSLNTSVQVAFPTKLTEGLADAAPDDLADVEISASGLGLHWPRLDADVYVPGVLQGVFGSKQWMAQQFGAAGGRVRSAKKVAAARNNGHKGGRPRKTA